MAIIKQCKSCEKKGVFLKLYKGLCEECTNELNFLEKHYYEIESIISGTLEITDPNKVIDQANIILNNIDKFKNTYTPIKKELCLEVISLMKNLLDDEKNENDSEPIYFYPETYPDEILVSPESTLNSLSEDSSENTDKTEVLNESDKNTDLKENINLSSKEDLILKNISYEAPIIEEDINTSETLVIEDESLDFTLPESIVLDEDIIKGLTIEIEPNTTNSEAPKKPLVSENNFTNISFEEETPKVEEKIELSQEANIKTESSKTLGGLKKLLDELERTLSKDNSKINITQDNIEIDKSEITESNQTSTVLDIEPANIIQEDEVDEQEPIENKSIEDLTLESILKLNGNNISPEERGYTIEVLKSYSSELQKKEVYALDNINLEKFIVKQEKQLLKEINKHSFEVFNFFNYVSFSIVKESEKIYNLSAVKVCYGKIIDRFNSKYSVNNSNNELDSLEDVAHRFINFIDKMTLVTHNANFNLKTLKTSFSSVKGIYLNNNFICTRNSYIKLCSRLSMPKPANIDLYVCLRYFLSNEEIEEINEISSIDFSESIKTFKLYEKLKYLI